MSAKPFAIPCVLCGGPPRSHNGETIIHPGQHEHEPDESSPEWAALKLREALKAARSPIADDCISFSTHRKTLALIDAALALADAAGIRGEP